MDDEVRALFETYARVFAQGLRGEADKAAAADLYASAFVAASPQGVIAGTNDDELGRVMAEGYARYRESGMTAIELRDVRIDRIDELHRTAHVDWRATYARPDRPDLPVDFTVHYFVQRLGDGPPKVFGWVSGDEEALLREHGLA